MAQKSTFYLPALCSPVVSDNNGDGDGDTGNNHHRLLVTHYVPDIVLSSLCIITLIVTQ